MKYPNGSESVLSPGPFAQLLKVKNVPCTDGKTRTATITGEPQTFSTIPARVHAHGKTVSGFLTMSPTYKEGVKEGYIFYPYTYMKNGKILPLNFNF